MVSMTVCKTRNQWTRNERFGRSFYLRWHSLIVSQSLLNRDNPTLAYPTHPPLAVDAYPLTRQSGVQFRRIESQVEIGRTACEELHV